MTDVPYIRGYKHSANEYSLFYKKAEGSDTFLGVHVDDILMTRDDENEIQTLKLYLDATFNIKDLGETHYFLGMEILPTANVLVLTQRKFAKDLREEFGDKDAKHM